MMTVHAFTSQSFAAKSGTPVRTANVAEPRLNTTSLVSVVEREIPCSQPASVANLQSGGRQLLWTTSDFHNLVPLARVAAGMSDAEIGSCFWTDFNSRSFSAY